MTRFDNQIALVTGSARGIGRAIALKLAHDGADVVVNYRKSGPAAEQLVQEIRALGRRAIAVEADMGQPSAITELFARIQRELGGLDFLICNAAGGIRSSALEITTKGWDLAMNVNARSYLLCAQAAVPMLKARGGGRIIALTARIATDRALPQYASVAASKAAIHALTTYLAVELGPHDIVVNAVSPGLVDTDALQSYRVGPALLRDAIASTPVGRVTTSEDVADLVAFLCSAEAHQIAGQILTIDGGYARLFR